ncbi:MAG: hypothetical protein ACK4GQ_05075 [Candidatus Hadarchaeales archaeon]
MNMSIVAFDTKEFRRGIDKAFFAPIGVSLTIDDAEEFKLVYDRTFDELFPKFADVRERKVYSTYELIERWGLPKTIAFIEMFLNKIQHLIKKMGVYYTILPPTKVPCVKKYGAEGRVKEIETVEFLRELNPYYTYCCAWRYAQDMLNQEDKLLLDNFEGKITGAWIELTKNCKGRFWVYPHGDRCNPLISAADMMVALVDYRLYRSKKRLDSSGITSVFSSAPFEVKPVFIGQPHLSKISPKINRMINLMEYYKRPIIFILLEKLELIRSEAERRMFERSMLMNFVVNMAFEKDCPIKYFDPIKDSDIISDGDILVCIGEKAEADAKVIKNLFDIQIVSMKDLVTKQK